MRFNPAPDGGDFSPPSWIFLIFQKLLALYYSNFATFSFYLFVPIPGIFVFVGGLDDTIFVSNGLEFSIFSNWIIKMAEKSKFPDDEFSMY